MRPSGSFQVFRFWGPSPWDPSSHTIQATNCSSLTQPPHHLWVTSSSSASHWQQYGSDWEKAMEGIVEGQNQDMWQGLALLSSTSLQWTAQQSKIEALKPELEAGAKWPCWLIILWGVCHCAGKLTCSYTVGGFSKREKKERERTTFGSYLHYAGTSRKTADKLTRLVQKYFNHPSVLKTLFWSLHTTKFNVAQEMHKYSLGDLW